MFGRELIQCFMDSSCVVEPEGNISGFRHPHRVRLFGRLSRYVLPDPIDGEPMGDPIEPGA